MIICNWFDWPPNQTTKNGVNQANCKLSYVSYVDKVIKQEVYLHVAYSKCTALVKLALHASIVCRLVAFLASQ